MRSRRLGVAANVTPTDHCVVAKCNDRRIVFLNRVLDVTPDLVERRRLKDRKITAFACYRVKDAA